jgi:NAD(P)-dependent dehydrogenase (short-subunit alcohol dehydrogenase family)
MAIRRTWVQLFPSKPTLTSANLPPQPDKAVIITGSTSGIGHELSRILSNAGATVYMAARNETKAKTAIESITASKMKPNTVGKLVFLHVDLSDLRTIKPFVDSFLALESRLDLLFSNAGCSRSAALRAWSLIWALTAQPHTSLPSSSRPPWSPPPKVWQPRQTACE